MYAPQQIPGCKLVHLRQRSPEWLAWRNGLDLPDGKPRITGTVAAIIAGDSVTGKTAHQLWMEQTKRKEPEEPSEFLKKLFEHGSKTEALARRVYEELTGNRVFDMCVEHPDHPWAAASLDGITELGDLIWEGKAPISQRVHTLAKRRIVPAYYVPQVQWQLFCTPTALEAHYFSYFEDDEEGIKWALVVVQRDPVYQAWLFQQCLDFRMCVIENRPPASFDWLMAARTYKQAKLDVEEAQAKLATATQAVLDMIPLDRDSFDGGGLLATRYYVGQTVDWKQGFKEAQLKDDVVAAAEEACREPGIVDYQKLVEDVEPDPIRRKALEDRFRSKGAVDFKKAAAVLGLSKAEIKLLEAKHKSGGDVRHKITITSDYVPLVTPPGPETVCTPTARQIVVEAKAVGAPVPALNDWSGW
jgi:putative phage-type endonuclease